MVRPSQKEQYGGVTRAPASTSVWIYPSFMAASIILLEAGVTMHFTWELIFLPFITFAAILRSSKRPLVQEPINT